jgi:iron complex transport system substrate-binding protein
VAELIRAGIPVFCTNPRSVDEVMQSILTVGGVIGAEPAARALVLDMHDEINQLREFSSVWPDRPRVYFEEWHDPLITGIRWVSELVELAGGRDVFSDLRDRRGARDRVVDPAEVARRDPEIILVSWCGKPADVEVIRSRPGWDRVSAVQHGRVHEIDGADVLSPGPSMLVGLRQIHELVQQALRERD